jgi:hypothetical protein
MDAGEEALQAGEIGLAFPRHQFVTVVLAGEMPTAGNLFGR